MGPSFEECIKILTDLRGHMLDGAEHEALGGRMDSSAKYEARADGIERGINALNLAWEASTERYCNDLEA